MSRKTIEVFESDYDTLLLRAGEPNKIAFVVQNLIKLSNACKDDLLRLKTWLEAAEEGTTPIKK